MPEQTRPPRPRDAASLVIHRPARGGHEVLMGRRGSRARFKPGVYVFPGGVLERCDFHARPASSLHPGLTPELAVGGSPRRADALAMAAVREAFEEAGLLFGSAGHVGNVRHASWRQFRERELAPDLGALDYLGRAITPSHRPLRFHARFFGVPYERFEGELAGDGELEDLRWVRLDRRADLPMMIVQQLILDTLGERLAGRRAPPQRLIFLRGPRRDDQA
ncbi:MAG: NUDIX hydrolase [Gammaproteobacteria bacterium]